MFSVYGNIYYRELSEFGRTGNVTNQIGFALRAISDATLFDDDQARVKSARVMAVMDTINRTWGRGTLRSAAIGNSQSWGMRSEMRSPRYTTAWDELPVAP